MFIVCAVAAGPGPPLSFINEEQPEVGKAIAATLLVFVLNELLRHHSGYRGRVPGSKTRRRIRGNIRSIFDEYGPVLFRRAFRMHEVSFWKLLDLIEASMGSKGSGKRKRGATPNGTVPNSVRLAVALRYFAGGDPLDIALVYHITPCVVHESVWIVVDAINKTNELNIKFPTSHEEQLKVASEFKARSAAGFDNCAGCIDGMLIWTHKPTKPELEVLGIGSKKFFCGRKKKFGLNLQAVCDARRRFLDVEIKHPGSTSDYLAFALSRLHQKLEGRSPQCPTLPFLCPGLALYGDNAYVNTKYMVVPFKNVSEGAKDAFNFYHSQVRIIRCLKVLRFSTNDCCI